MIAQMTARLPLRADKAVVGAITIFLLGWMSCTAAYKVDELGWLRFRSSEFEQVKQAVGSQGSTKDTVTKTKQLVRAAKVANAMGCLQPLP